MAAENPDIRDRTKTDPDIANKFAWLKQEAEIGELIIKPRIEDAALTALEDLNTLLTSMTDKELDEDPGEDILKNLYHNDVFVTERIMSPTLFELIERTEQTVFLTEREILGYAYIEIGVSEEDDDESDDPGVGLVVDDAANDIWLPIETPGELQSMWDTSPRYVRQDMQIFAGMTKREIVDRFFDFVFEYANPGAEPIN